MRRFLIAASIVATLGAVAPVGAQDGAVLYARLEATLEDFHARYGFPGATAAISLPDGKVATAATGLADVEAGRAMTPETPMLAASIGKTFVAATVLALENEGRLLRADLLADHLGDRPWFSDLPNAETMTIGHLLRHSAGLPDHVHLPAFQAAWAKMVTGEGVITPEDLVGFVTGMDPLFEVGTAWAYSDTGYILLGLVIEAVTGQPYHEVVHTRFLDPLALADTFPSDRRDLPGLAVGYLAPGNPFGLQERTADAEGRLLWDPAVEWTGGGLASTSHDLARWGHLLFGGAAMAAPYLDRLLGGVPVAPGVLYGAGVAIHPDTPRGPVYGHGGWIPAYVSSLRHYADHGLTVAFQINTDAGFIDDSSDRVSDMEAALADLALEVVQ
ncbi:beta-lactamase family protein [Halomonas sp. TRM85114]|uniref:serine hydrolase domain-containing protein n=1 Tax=Halomonas jincaotanensis TaxID=2810616 RepID=UPI001BD3210A|nr:serine hydrolase domain-containing protein [Halomonas jincaotanensis]MBS9405273.1 beta-lactamase family protein [Halomonas jincaotanensis]